MADNHIYYELAHLVAFNAFGNVMPIAMPIEAHRLYAQRRVAECLLESALVHVRNLADFLVDRRPTSKGRRTDIVADHYFTPTWKGRRNFAIGRSKREHERLMKEIDWRVAHLTSKRISVMRHGPQDWGDYVTTQIPVLIRSFRRFLDQLAEQHPRRLKWFERCDSMLADFGYPSAISTPS